ncbi:MAG: acyl carrier protein [Lachnospiraceae bacterium]
MTFDKVKEIIIETINCDEAQITMDADLKEDLGVDSLDSMELVMALEEAYGITIEEEAATGLTSVKSIVEYIDSHVA